MTQLCGAGGGREGGITRGGERRERGGETKRGRDKEREREGGREGETKREIGSEGGTRREGEETDVIESVYIHIRIYVY